MPKRSDVAGRPANAETGLGSGSETTPVPTTESTSSQPTTAGSTTTAVVMAGGSTTVASVTSTTFPPVTDANSLSPICGVPASGAGCRIIAFYGNPLSTRMGALGASPPQQMIPALMKRTQEWRDADPVTPTRCAMELIAITAQAQPGKNNKHRLRMSDETIDRVLGWARGAGCLLILDVQVGWSSVPEELPSLQRWLDEPDVHLALDPEWDMPPGIAPGRRIGTMTASDIQFGIDLLARTVSAKNLPPKMLIVHRFREFMVTNPEQIVNDPAVRLVVNMDGFGPPEVKMNSYRVAMLGMPTRLTGFKLFFINDQPMLDPAYVLAIDPAPVFINYQ